MKRRTGAALALLLAVVLCAAAGCLALAPPAEPDLTRRDGMPPTATGGSSVANSSHGHDGGEREGTGALPHPSPVWSDKPSHTLPTPTPLTPPLDDGHRTAWPTRISPWPPSPTWPRPPQNGRDDVSGIPGNGNGVGASRVRDGSAQAGNGNNPPAVVAGTGPEIAGTGPDSPPSLGANAPAAAGLVASGGPVGAVGDGGGVRGNASPPPPSFGGGPLSPGASGGGTGDVGTTDPSSPSPSSSSAVSLPLLLGTLALVATVLGIATTVRARMQELDPLQDKPAAESATNTSLGPALILAPAMTRRWSIRSLASSILSSSPSASSSSSSSSSSGGTLPSPLQEQEPVQVQNPTPAETTTAAQLTFDEQLELWSSGVVPAVAAVVPSLISGEARGA